jgi:hypothetical protein
MTAFTCAALGGGVGAAWATAPAAKIVPESQDMAIVRAIVVIEFRLIRVKSGCNVRIKAICD